MKSVAFAGRSLPTPKPWTGQSIGISCRPTTSIRMSMVAPAAPLEVKNFEGETIGSESLSLKVADPEVAKGLVHRYVVKVRRDMRKGNASTKTRAEVRGGGRKPFPQKGRGAARRGSTRSPLIRGGGVIFGPKPKDWSIDMNKKERRLAFATAFQSAAEDLIIIESLQGKFSDIKTKSVVAALERLGIDQNEHCLLITHEKNDDLYQAGKNIKRLKMNTSKHLSVYDVLRADKIIIEKDALEYVQSFYGPKIASV
eukprot:g861.t1